MKLCKITWNNERYQFQSNSPQWELNLFQVCIENRSLTINDPSHRLSSEKLARLLHIRRLCKPYKGQANESYRTRPGM